MFRFAMSAFEENITASKGSKYGVFYDLHFPEFGLNTEICSLISVFSANTGKCAREKAPYSELFNAVSHVLRTLDL